MLMILCTEYHHLTACNKESVKKVPCTTSMTKCLEVDNVTKENKRDFLIKRKAPELSGFKRLPADLAVPSSEFPDADIFSVVCGAPLHTASHS